MSGARTWHPAPLDAPAPALLWLVGSPGARLPLGAFTAAGISVRLATDLADEEAPDRASVREIAREVAALAARPEVDPERIAVGGEGRGGTLAFLAGCHTDAVAAVVNLFGPLVYAGIGARRPAQPLELALNLGAPLLAVMDESMPGTSPEDQRRAAEVLSQFARDFDIVPASRSEWGPLSDAGETGAEGGASASDDWGRLLSFLQRAFEEV